MIRYSKCQDRDAASIVQKSLSVPIAYQRRSCAINSDTPQNESTTQDHKYSTGILMVPLSLCEAADESRD